LLEFAFSLRFAQATAHDEEVLAQDFQAGLSEYRCDQRSDDLTGGAPQQRAAFA
jgi:hypothetical protein